MLWYSIILGLPLFSPCNICGCHPLSSQTFPMSSTHYYVYYCILFICTLHNNMLFLSLSLCVCVCVCVCVTIHYLPVDVAKEFLNLRFSGIVTTDQVRHRLRRTLLSYSCGFSFGLLTIITIHLLYTIRIELANKYRPQRIFRRLYLRNGKSNSRRSCTSM